MAKKTILYASPFPPMKSGISDYSERLVNVLKSKFDITLYIDDYKVDKAILDNFKVLRHNVDKINFDNYDYVIYNIGNNEKYHQYIYEACLKHPGYVILHDYVIFNLFYGLYKSKNIFYEKLYRNAQMKDFFTVKCMVKEGCFDINKIAKIPLNEEILNSQNKIIVHSYYSYNKIKDFYERSQETRQKAKHNLFKFTHLALNENDAKVKKIIPRDLLFKKYGIPLDTTLIASFGNIVPTKLNDVSCKVIDKIMKKYNKNVCYLLVGSGDTVNAYLKDGQIIKTGYATIEEFESFIKYSDIIINLRYPSMGETSGAMIRILQCGKPCIINADGWFAEIPQNAVCQVSRKNLEENLEKVILNLLDNESLRKEIGNNAKKYIDDEYSDSKILNDFVKIISTSIKDN